MIFRITKRKDIFIMVLKLMNDKELEVEQSLIDSNYMVDVIKEVEGFLIISDVDNVDVKFPKNIVEVNDIKISSNKMLLSDSLYNHYFGDKRNMLDVVSLRSLDDNFSKIFNNKDLIFDNAEFFLIRDGFLSSGYCLGSLLESWEQSDDLTLCENGEKIFLMRACGSPFSGRNSWTGWSQKRGEIVYGRFQCNWSEWIKKFYNSSARKPIALACGMNCGL